jgi:predicted RNase H-like HicB family nuclease
MSTIKVRVSYKDATYIAHQIDTSNAAQGATSEEAVENLRELLTMRGDHHLCDEMVVTEQ